MVQNHEVNQQAVEVSVVEEVGSRILAACMTEELSPEELDRREVVEQYPVD